MSAGEPDATTPPGEPPTGPPPDADAGDEQGFWSAYWERFRRQEVDDPIEERREGMWDRFRRQEVDAPIDR